MDIDKLLIDTKAIEAGKWQPLGADFPGVEVFVTGLSSPEAMALKSKLERNAPREDRHRNGQLTDEAGDRIIKRVILAKCLKDWRGFTRGGDAMEYSRDMAELFLLKDEGRVIGKAIVDAIVALEDTRQASGEEYSGN